MGVFGQLRGNYTHPPKQKLGFSHQQQPLGSDNRVYRRGKHIIIVTAVTTSIWKAMYVETLRNKMEGKIMHVLLKKHMSKCII